MSNLVHKIKDAVTSDKKHEEPTGTHGHHDNRAANAADPRIDSDRDGRANPTGPNTTGTAGGFSSGTTGAHGSSGLTGTTGTTGTSAGVGGLDNRGLGGPATRTDGPHGSNMVNKADPRVDSDRDHSRNMGANPSGTASTGNYTSTTGTHGSSGLAGTTGTHGSSGLTGTTGTHGTTTGSVLGSGPGPAANTAGPHKSDMLNKADPRVDSNLDGSKTVGQDKTFTQS